MKKTIPTGWKIVFRTGGTKTIHLRDVKLLCDASGTEMPAFKPGGGDLSALSTRLALQAHLENAFMTLSPGASLLRIHPVALIRVLTLRFPTAELLCLEQFGHLVRKYPVIIPIWKSKHSVTFGDMMVMPSTKYLWARTNSLTALMNEV